MPFSIKNSLHSPVDWSICLASFGGIPVGQHWGLVLRWYLYFCWSTMQYSLSVFSIKFSLPPTIKTTKLRPSYAHLIRYFSQMIITYFETILLSWIPFRIDVGPLCYVDIVVGRDTISTFIFIQSRTRIRVEMQCFIFGKVVCNSWWHDCEYHVVNFCFKFWQPANQTKNSTTW